MQGNNRLKKMVIIAMLSGVAAVIMMFDFPVLPAAPFLQVDLSDIPAIIGGIIFGPIAGAAIVLFKNVLNILIAGTNSLGIGQLANFVSGSMFVIPLVYIFRKNQTFKGLVRGMIVGTIVTTIGSAIFNYFVLLPMYVYFLNFPIPNKLDFVLTIVIPFNVIKGAIVSIVFAILYPNIRTWLKGLMARLGHVKVQDDVEHKTSNLAK